MLSGNSLADFQEALKDVLLPETACEPRRGALPPRPRSELTAFQHVNQCALQNIPAWGQIAFPQGTLHSTGAVRVRPEDMGRPYEEDLSIAPTGIRDFGQEVSHTPIGLLCSHFVSVTPDGELEPAELDENGDPMGSLSPEEAARWLCGQLDMDWDAEKAEDERQLQADFDDGLTDTAEYAAMDAHSGPKSVAKLRLIFPFDEQEPAAPEARDFVEDLLCDGALSLGFGESGVGKTWAVSYLALCVALGWPFHGRDVEQGGVVYLAMEGATGLRQRIEAFRREHGMKETSCARLAIVSDTVNFRDKHSVGAFIAAVKEAGPRLGGVRLIVVDTVSRALCGGNENASEDMGAFVNAADRIRNETGAHVLAVHHSGKDDTKGARGHSLLRAAVDSEFKIEKSEGGLITMRVTKQREVETRGVFAFRLRTVVLGENRRGKPVTSCVVEPAETPKPALSGAEADAAEILKTVLFESDGTTVPIATWRKAFMQRLEAEGVAKAVTRRSQWKRAMDGLRKRGVIEVSGKKAGLKMRSRLHSVAGCCGPLQSSKCNAGPPRCVRFAPLGGEHAQRPQHRNSNKKYPPGLKGDVRPAPAYKFDHGGAA